MWDAVLHPGQQSSIIPSRKDRWWPHYSLASWTLSSDGRDSQKGGCWKAVQDKMALCMLCCFMKCVNSCYFVLMPPVFN